MDLINIKALGDIEKILRFEIKGLKYWGNLDLSFDDYEHLNNMLSERIKSDSLKSILKVYPVSMTTAAVFFVRFKFVFNFWEHWAKELDINITMTDRKKIGEQILTTFSNHEFDFEPVKNDPHKYVAPILYQACFPPESCLDDLFFAIKNNNRSHFDPQIFIEELITEKAYSIRKPMRVFLENFQDSDAIEYVLNIRDAMIAVEQRGTVETRYEEQYQEWAENEKVNQAKRGKTRQEQHQIKPYLKFEEGKNGLCVVLPWTILSKEWVEDARWTVCGSNGKTTGITCRVFGNNGKRYIESITIPVSPAAAYSITLRDAESETDTDLCTWNIAGVTDFMCFNASGTAVSSKYLPVPFCSLVIEKSAVIEENQNITLIDQHYPNENEDYRTVCAMSASPNALLQVKTAERTITLSPKPKVDICLNGSTLFDIPSESDANLFVELPTVSINLSELAFKQDIEIRIGTRQIPIKCEAYEDWITIDLNDYYAPDEQKLGTYSIRLYQSGHFLRQTEFSYVPPIKTDYVYNLVWPGRKNKNREYHFEVPEGWELSFDGCRVERNGNTYVVNYPESTGIIHGVLRSTIDEFVFRTPFTLPLIPVSLMIIDSESGESENVHRGPLSFGLHEFLEQNKWLAATAYGEYSNKSFSIDLFSVDGLEQSAPLRISANGDGITTLSVFRTTLQNCVLPAKLEVRCADETDQGIPILVITDKALLKEYPVYLPKEKGIVVLQEDSNRKIEFSRFGNKPLTYRIEEDEWQLYRGFSLHRFHQELPAGIYSFTDNDTLSLFDLEEDSITDLKQQNPAFLIYSDDMSLYPKESIHYMLQYLINLIFRKRQPTDIEDDAGIRKILHGEITITRVRELNDFEVELLIALGYLINSKISKERTKAIVECMKIISEDVLSGIDRTRIIRMLTEMKCPQAVFDSCNSAYSLFLFDPDDNDMKSLSKDVEPYSLNLAYLMLIDTDVPFQETIGLEKYRTLIGSEALKNMLSYSEANHMEIKKFLNDERTDNIHVNLSPEISGEMQPLMDMIEEKRGKFIFNLDKKPETGIYFNQIRFCDQYVNWYRLNHTYDGSIYPITKTRMLDIVNEQTIARIDESIAILQKDRRWQGIFNEYYKALQFRFRNNQFISLKIISLPRYFYLQGLAAFFSRIPGSETDIVFVRETGNRFLSKAYEVSPRMATRDILMASTFIYLKKKEEELCQ